jgi:hypothetical protein
VGELLRTDAGLECRSDGEREKPSINIGELLRIVLHKYRYAAHIIGHGQTAYESR